MSATGGPDSEVAVRIEIKLERDYHTKLWRLEVYAHWKSVDGEVCDYVGGSDDYEYATRRAATVKVDELVSTWLAKYA